MRVELSRGVACQHEEQSILLLALRLGYALALKDDAVSLDDPSLKVPEKRALFFGNEGSGLSRAVLDACDAHGFQVASGTSMLLENTKDANDSLLKDREAFSQRIQKTVQDAKNAIQANAYRQRFRAIYAAGSIETPKNGEETFLKWMSTGMANRREGYIPYALRQAKNAGWTGEQMELALMRYAPQTVYRGRSYAKELVSGICVKPQFEREK